MQYRGVIPYEPVHDKERQEMRLISREFKLQGRSAELEIYPLGDLHIGSRDCAEGLLKKAIKDINDNPNARWIGGGDYLDAIKPSDSKRFDMDTFPTGYSKATL